MLTARPLGEVKVWGWTGVFSILYYCGGIEGMED